LFEYDQELSFFKPQEAHDSYVTWCGQNGYRPMNHTNFGKEVKRTLPCVREERIRSGGRLMSVYLNLVVREDSQLARPQSYGKAIHCSY